MKTVVFAYRTVGYECIKYLIDIAEPPTVIIPYDDDGIDGSFKSVKKLVLDNNINYMQPQNLKNNTTLEIFIKELKPDVAFSCYFPIIIPINILSYFKYGGLNLHGGILPEYRGTFSGVWSIINDEIESGVTIHYMDKQVDVGDIVEIKRCAIKDEYTGLNLYEKTSQISVELFKKYYHLLKNNGTLLRIPQKLSNGNYYSRKIPYDGVINWEWRSRKIYNFCRALNFKPYKGALTYLNGKEFEVTEVSETVIKSKKIPGSIISYNEDGILVSTQTNDIRINNLKYNCMTIPAKSYSEYGIKENLRFK